jgi:hypothetical protein
MHQANKVGKLLNNNKVTQKYQNLKHVGVLLLDTNSSEND